MNIRQQDGAQQGVVQLHHIFQIKRTIFHKIDTGESKTRERRLHHPFGNLDHSGSHMGKEQKRNMQKGLP